MLEDWLNPEGIQTLYTIGPRLRDVSVGWPNGGGQEGDDWARSAVRAVPRRKVGGALLRAIRGESEAVEQARGDGGS